VTLIKSISGIRGTIGGAVSNNLTPLDVVRFTSAYAQWLNNTHKGKLTVVTGRDARISGAMIHGLVNQTLVGMGVNVVDLGLSTTPTVALSVPQHQAQGGIVLTASHNPKQWNALKLLSEKGEFINAEAGAKVLDYASQEAFQYAAVDDLGQITKVTDAIHQHIQDCLKLKWVHREQIKQRNFKVVVDGVNSSGGIAIPTLLEVVPSQPRATKGTFNRIM
jgi:phosphomannomutase